MEKPWCAVCALILALGAFVHFNTVAAADADRDLKGTFVLTSVEMCVSGVIC